MCPCVSVGLCVVSIESQHHDRYGTIDRSTVLTGGSVDFGADVWLPAAAAFNAAAVVFAVTIDGNVVRHLILTSS